MDDYEQKLAEWKKAHGLAVDMPQPAPRCVAVREDDDPPDDEDFGNPEYCEECGGDGWISYMDAGPSYWGEDCPSEVDHPVTCRACRGTGLSR